MFHCALGDIRYLASGTNVLARKGSCNLQTPAIEQKAQQHQSGFSEAIRQSLEPQEDCKTRQRRQGSSPFAAASAARHMREALKITFIKEVTDAAAALQMVQRRGAGPRGRGRAL